MNPELNQNQINNINEQINQINQGLGGVNQQMGSNLQNLPTLSLNQPTASNGFGTNIPTPQTSELESMILNRFNESQNFNPEDIRSNALSMFQPQIDAINQLYSGLIADAQREGRGRLGSQRAISARGGLIGSQRGEAQREQVQDLNRQIVGSIQAEQAAKISAIMGQANQFAQEELRQRTEAAQRGAEEYMSFLASKEERQRNNANAVMNSLLQQGLSFDELDPEQRSSLANQLGFSEADLRNIYQGAFIQATAREAEQFTLSEGQKRFQINPETGEIEMIAFNPKTQSASGSGESESTRMQQINWMNELIRLNPGVSNDQLRQTILENAPGISVTLVDTALANKPKQTQTFEQQKAGLVSSLFRARQQGQPAEFAAIQATNQITKAMGVSSSNMPSAVRQLIQDSIAQAYGLTNNRAKKVLNNAIGKK